MLSYARAAMCLLMVSFVFLAPAAAQFKDLVRRAPDGANAVVVLDVAKMHSSPLGVKEQWKEQHKQAMGAGLTLVPPHASQYLLAAKFDFESMQSNWSSSVMEVTFKPDAPKLAFRTGGSIDELEGCPAVVLPIDMYVIEFGPTKVGTMSPANRQQASQWLKQVYSNSNRQPLSPYLAEAVGYAEQVGTPVILALDVEGFVSPARVRERLAEAETLQGREVDLDKLSQALASIRGITLGVTIRDKMYGKIKIDFRGDVSAVKEFAKPLFLEALAKRGAMIDEFDGWTVGVTANQVTLEGELLSSGMERILSVVDAPPKFYDALQQREPVVSGEGQSEESQQQLMALASQQYYNAVERMLSDLRGKRSTEDFHTWGQVGMWFERYARRIDQLPILNVDPELVDFGAFVSSQLRGGETAMKSIGPASRLRQQEVPAYYRTYSYSAPIASNWWGTSSYTRTYSEEDIRARGAEQARIRTQEKIRGNMSANAIMQGLDQALGDIRRHLTQKYNLEF